MKNKQIKGPRDPIPARARRVFKGKIFEVWQWPQKMYDGSSHIFERLKRPDTAQIIAVVGGKILIQSQKQPDRKKPFTSLPGGRCDNKESPRLAAQRELLEETGYESNNWLLWKQHNPVSKIEWTIHTFIARDCILTGKPRLDSGEKIKNKLISFTEFLNLAEDKSFYDPQLVIILLRARHDARKKIELYDLLFKKHQ